MIAAEQVLAVLIAALAGAAAAFGVLIYVTQRLQRRDLERLQTAVTATKPHSPVDVISDVGGILGILVRVSRSVRTVAPVSALLERATTRTRRMTLHSKLESAGMREYLAPQDLADAQLVGAVGSALLLLLLGGFGLKNIALSTLIGVVMWRLSLMPLTNAIQDRQARIQGALPKCADILVVAVEAGMTLDRAMALYIDRFKGPLGDELRRIQEDVKVGHRRREAFRAAMDRVALEDLTRFLGAVQLAERFGVPIAMVLRDQSEALKQRRAMRIREATMKAPIKMLLPTVGLILPALLIVLIGPLVVIVAKGELF